MKEIIDIVHKSIYPFFDVCEKEEEPLTEKDKLLLKVNKAICNNLKALERESCEDSISRQAVLDAIHEADMNAYDEQSLIRDLTQAVNELPSVKPQEPKWIPVSEGLPKEAYGCLVTVLDTNVITQDEFENILPYFVGYDGETWNDADGNICPFEVIAWMPLPESYKAESEDT